MKILFFIALTALLLLGCVTDNTNSFTTKKEQVGLGVIPKWFFTTLFGWMFTCILGFGGDAMDKPI